MQRKPSSKQNTTASRPSYKCPHCQKVYHTSNALGGHQSAHRHEGGVSGLSPVLAAVLTHPIPLDDDDDDDLLASPQAGAGVQPGFNGQGDRSKTKQGSEDLRLKPRAGNGSHKDHPNVRTVSEECLTKDLLREWVLMSSVGEFVKVERSYERTITDPIVRVSKGNKEVDEVTSKGKVDIDLELKLGF